jgi:predicted phosphoribosyltransferase
MTTINPFAETYEIGRFADRSDAGRILAGQLAAYRNRADVIVLGLPRGGVPVAFEVARALRVPLDVFVVRKLGVPGYPELAMGAIASGGVSVLNDDVVREAGISADEIREVAAIEQRELDRRERAYRGHAVPLSLRGRTAILVDDGLATGATMRAAVKAARRLQALRVVVAVPVGSAITCQRVAHDADKVICPMMPPRFRAIGEWYDDFSQVSDEQVRELLARSLVEAGEEPAPVISTPMKP